MKIEIFNFGPIEYLAFDMEKDLHLLYGQNAVGKSYATYCIYCLLKTLKKLDHVNIFDLVEDEASIKRKFKKQTLSEIVSDYPQLIETELGKMLIPLLENSLLNTFISLENLGNRFTHQNYEIVITLNDDAKLILRSNQEGRLKLIHLPAKQEKLSVKEKNGSYSLFVGRKKFYPASNFEDEVDFLTNFYVYVRSEAAKILAGLLHGIKDIYFLPASRSGLYQALNAFSPIIAELTQNRFFLKKRSIELPALSEPLSDYFIELSTVDKKHINKEFKAIINTLQNDILKGEVIYDDKTNRIYYKPNGLNLELNLSESSSMVAEISPIVIYLKHIIKYNPHSTNYHLIDFTEKGEDILFIEEPEAHLHPEVQVLLMQVFVKLAKLNVKVFITSHSNYMFNQLNNMLLAGSADKEKIAVYHLVKNEKGSTQNMDMVVTEDGINDDNFQEVSERLYTERMRIYEDAR